MITIFIPFLFVYFAYSKHIEVKKKKAQVSKKKKQRGQIRVAILFTPHIRMIFIANENLHGKLPPNRSFDILCVLKSAIVFFLFTSQAIKRIYMEQYRFHQVCNIIANKRNGNHRQLILHCKAR